MADEYPQTIFDEIENEIWERKHPKHFISPFSEFTIYVSADTSDAECAALAEKCNCRVVRDTK